MEKIGIYPGTFDPITNGHIDIIKRSILLFDKLIIAIAENPSKLPLFSSEERVDLIRSSLKEYPEVIVDTFHGLLVDYGYKHNAVAIIRGLRAVSDFEHEFQMALMNRNLSPYIETIFMMTAQEYSYLSSSVVKEIAFLGGDVSSFVTKSVAEALRKKGNRLGSVQKDNKEFHCKLQI